MADLMLDEIVGRVTEERDLQTVLQEEKIKLFGEAPEKQILQTPPTSPTKDNN